MVAVHAKGFGITLKLMIPRTRNLNCHRVALVATTFDGGVVAIFKDYNLNSCKLER